MRVLLADDHRLLLEGLANLLAAHGIEVVALAHDGVEALALARQLRPDVALLDIRMPGGDGLTASRAIHAALPETRIVILTTSNDDDDLFEAVKSGAYGYLLKSMDAGALIDCLEGVMEGTPPFSPGLADKLLAEFGRLATASKIAGIPPAGPTALTDRQRQVLELVAAGLTYKEVGARLNLSPRTIKYHMGEIMAVLHLEHRAQVLAYAGRAGLAPD
ncbi:MAG: response regulator transcription factor [Candidatus Promineofilum sp.]|nr:response regulator transcription factor [Promineifilum sp.]